MIYIVGLGPNESLSIKESIKELLLANSNKKIIVRTEEHPAVEFLNDNGIAYETCDRFYVENDNFADTYNNIATYVLEQGRNNDVFYLVPGHPMVAELTTKLILAATNEAKVIGGESFLDSCFNAAQFDPVEGFLLVDATDGAAFTNVDPKKHILITQCYDDLTAANISVELDRYYPYDYEVTVLENVGCADEKIYKSALAELSATVGEQVNNLRTIYVPPFEEALNFNIKNYVPEYREEVTTSGLVANVEASLEKIKNLASNHADNVDELVSSELSKILKNILDFTSAEEFYIELEDILKNMQEK